MQNTYDISISTNAKNSLKQIYKVDEKEEKKTHAIEEAKGMVKSGIARDKTIDYLIEAGYSSKGARQQVSKLELKRKRTRNRKAQRKILKGVVLVIIGLVIVVGSNTILPVNVGFLMAGLTIFFGGILFFRGLTGKIGL